MTHGTELLFDRRRVLFRQRPGRVQVVLVDNDDEDLVELDDEAELLIAELLRETETEPDE